MSFIRSFKIPLLLTTLLIVLHFFSKDFTNPYERPIGGDAQGYYAYLPALFIYGDWEYNFAAEMNAKYYPPGFGKSFVNETAEGEKVNKTFPGVAVLYAPFFAVAHTIAGLFGLEADGYSNIYQFFFLVGFWTYFLLGMIFFVKVLRKMNFASHLVSASLALLVLGTNIFFYSVHDQSVTHIYNFFMINAAIYYLMCFRDQKKFWQLGLGVFLLALIGITRPTNILVIPLLIFFIPQLTFYSALFATLKKPLKAVKALFILFAVFLIPLLLWKAQTGNWIVYSYGEEGFHFTDPHLFDFLFSYMKGWWTYTPIALIALVAGGIFLFRKSKGQAIYVFLFYAISIYVFSSWWCWYYGAGMGQRVMIDHYLLIGFLLLLLLQYLEGKRLLAGVFAVIFTACIGLNVAQAYQIRYGILPMGTPTKEQYWDNFLSTEKKARVYPRENWKKIQEFDLNLSPESNHLLKDYTRQYVEDEWTIHVSAQYEYSGIVRVVSNFDEGSRLIVGFDARSRTPVEETRLVVKASGGDREIQRSYQLSQFLKEDKWVPMEFLIEPPFGFTYFEVYFWNAGTKEKVEFRKLRLQHYYSDDYM